MAVASPTPTRFQRDRMNARGLLIDLDGTLYVGDDPIPGAVEAVQRLDELGIPRRYITNTTRFSREDLARHLGVMGFRIGSDELFTAPLAAADWLRAEGIERVCLYLPESTHAEFAGFDITAQSPEAIIVGDLGTGWNFDVMDQAFRQLLAGARLIALQRNRFWRTAAGLSLDAGPFVAALEYAAETEAVVVGKPSRPFFDRVAASLGMPAAKLAIVGDDLEAEIGGGQRAGLSGVLLRTGKFRQETLESSDIHPDRVADSFADAVTQLFPV